MKFKEMGFFRSDGFWNMKFKVFSFNWGVGLYFFGPLKPCGFKSHEHFSMLNDVFMCSEISSPLNSYFGPVFSIIKSSSQSFGGTSSFRGPYT